ncbi:hypothetical protein EHO58_13745 [Leptospira selangorensis]|uniref:hypothetical protein n=1 Tax=Leptospira selangorensis TaxID=2484982 RepID=UPI001082F645|nr:hypothetical protein [Leptospira selangorensis]TGK03482.1 hypothetical protein EHO58_13745 [Leptospira selangorensis]
MRYINSWILLCVFLLSSSVYSKDTDQTVEGYTLSRIRITNISVNSATANNAMSLINTRAINQVNSGSNEFVKPNIANFQGQGIEWETDIRHSNFIKTNYFLSHANLHSGSNNLNDLATLNFQPYMGSPVSITDLSFRTYSNNKLITSRVAFLTDFFFFENSSNKYLENLAFRIGVEAYGNTFSTSSKPYPYVGVSNGAPYSGIDAINQEKIKFAETFGNAVLGMNYKLNLSPVSSFDFGFEYFKSFGNDSKYENQYLSMSISSLGTYLPIASKATGLVKSELEGFRTSLGYRYYINEISFFRVSFAYQDSTQKVKDADVPSSGNLIISSDISQLLFTLASPPMGPFPNSRDTRSQFGIEFGYKY